MVCSRSQGNTSGSMIRRLRLCVAFFAFAPAIAPAYAQISFSTAVSLALKSNPKVLTAQADVDKALAAVQQIRDAYHSQHRRWLWRRSPLLRLSPRPALDLQYHLAVVGLQLLATRLPPRRASRPRCHPPQPQGHPRCCSRGHCRHLPRTRS